MRLFDAHAHYDDRRFDEEFDGGREAAIELAREAGVEYIVNVGSNLSSSRNSISLAAKYPFFYAAVGIHPSDAQEIPAGEVDSALDEIESMAKEKKVRAIGEIGFDYHYDGTDKARQEYFFRAQMEIAHRVNLPVIIHSRDAAGDTFDLIRSMPDSHGVLHSYSGSAETARQLVKMGWYLSFSGPITYKNARNVKESAAVVPGDRIMIETDCPYLPPTPHRGEINYSGYLVHTAASLGEIRGISAESAAEMTLKNAKQFYSIE